jgi:hypothetical protein
VTIGMVITLLVTGGLLFGSGMALGYFIRRAQPVEVSVKGVKKRTRWNPANALFPTEEVMDPVSPSEQRITRKKRPTLSAPTRR